MTRTLGIEGLIACFIRLTIAAASGLLEELPDSSATPLETRVQAEELPLCGGCNAI
jgi:hypothetical protein